MKFILFAIFLICLLDKFSIYIQRQSQQIVSIVLLLAVILAFYGLFTKDPDGS